MYTHIRILRHIQSALWLCLVVWLLNACRGEDIIYPTIGEQVTNDVQSGGLYVLCEGNMGSNKARLDYMNMQTGVYYSNWYGAMNPTQVKDLGDVGNDIQQYGHRLYAVINCSHKVEVMDLQARHISHIDIPNCRYLAFDKDKLFVSAYVGSVADPELLGSVYEIDTTTLQVTREVKVGHQPDQLCVVDGTIYVCNSGGYLTHQYDSTVSVIDIASFTEIERIAVGINPTRIQADEQGQLWVCCQGDTKSIAPQVVVLHNGQVRHRIQTACNNISIHGGKVYVLDAEQRQLRVISTTDYTMTTSPIHIEAYENPYALLATDEALYISDAKNYVSSGRLYCYNYDGTQRWVAQTGDIPGHLCRVAGHYDLQGDTLITPNPKGSPYIAHVYAYQPGMGQFVNKMPTYEQGDDAKAMCRKCEQALANNNRGTVSLGGWGGYIVFGFDHPLLNKEGKDLQILGNAFRMSGNSLYGGSEPGIIMVSQDVNQNGLPDDPWYEIKGSMYDHPSTTHQYTYTYTRASDTIRNPFHSQPYYPQWIAEDSITFTGALLASTTENINGQYVQQILDYGYADNQPNSNIEATSVDIDWAVDAQGNSVALDQVDFIKVYTAVQGTYTQIGELSTEILGAVDLHAQ